MHDIASKFPDLIWIQITWAESGHGVGRKACCCFTDWYKYLDAGALWEGNDDVYESEVMCGQVWCPILGICALHLTHPSAHTQQWTHTHREHTPGAVGSHLCCGARGAFGGLVPCSRAPQSWYWVWERALDIHSPHRQFLPDLRLEPTSFGLKVRLSIH